MSLPSAISIRRTLEQLEPLSHRVLQRHLTGDGASGRERPGRSAPDYNFEGTLVVGMSWLVAYALMAMTYFMHL